MANTTFPNFGNYQPQSNDINLIVSSLREQDEKRTCADGIFEPGITNSEATFVIKETGNTIKIEPLVAYAKNGKRIEIEAEITGLAPENVTNMLIVGGTWQVSTKYIITARYKNADTVPLTNPIDALNTTYARKTDSYTLMALRRTGSPINSFDANNDVRLAEVDVDASGNITVIVNSIDANNIIDPVLNLPITQYFHLSGDNIFDGITNTSIPTVYNSSVNISFKDHINAIGSGTISPGNPHGTNFSNINGTVSEVQIANDSVSTNKIQDLSITTIKISDSAVTSTKISSNLFKLWVKTKAYSVGDIVYPSDNNVNVANPMYTYLRAECVVAGKSGSTEPNWPTAWDNVNGNLVTDGTLKWIVEDIRDGLRPGDIKLHLGKTVPPGYVLANSNLLLRLKYPRLYNYAENESGIMIDDSAWPGALNIYYGYYSRGNGTTTFRVPLLSENFLRPTIGSNVGEYSEDTLKSHTHPYGAVDNLGMGGGDIYKGNANSGNPTGATGDIETKPKNIYLLALIKF